MPSTSFSRIGAVAIALLWATASGALERMDATKLPAKQSQGEVTVAVKPYHTEERMKEAFNKADPMKYGLFPVLLVVTNGGNAILNLEQMSVRYISARGDGIDDIPAADVVRWNPKGAQPRDKPRYIPSVPGMNRPKVKKGPLAKPEVENSGFDAPVLAPGESAQGFFFYNVTNTEDPVSKARMYISGIKNLATGQDLFYFEIDLQD